jgi:ankyrin repeat protein
LHNREAVAGAARELFEAIRANDVRRVRCAIAAGANVDQRWPLDRTLDGGNTPLLIGARLSDAHADVVSALIEAGADINAVDPVFGAVPLHKATYHGWTEVTRRLTRAHGINLNYQGPANGYTPLHDALWHAKPECAAVLIGAGARTDLRGYDGKLPADIARATLGVSHPIVLRLEGTVEAM